MDFTLHPVAPGDPLVKLPLPPRFSTSNRRVQPNCSVRACFDFGIGMSAEWSSKCGRVTLTPIECRYAGEGELVSGRIHHGGMMQERHAPVNRHILPVPGRFWRRRGRKRQPGDALRGFRISEHIPRDDGPSGSANSCGCGPGGKSAKSRRASPYASVFRSVPRPGRKSSQTTRRQGLSAQAKMAGGNMLPQRIVNEAEK